MTQWPLLLLLFLTQFVGTEKPRVQTSRRSAATPSSRPRPVSPSVLLWVDLHLLRVVLSRAPLVLSRAPLSEIRNLFSRSRVLALSSSSRMVTLVTVGLIVLLLRSVSTPRSPLCRLPSRASTLRVPASRLCRVVVALPSARRSGRTLLPSVALVLRCVASSAAVPRRVIPAAESADRPLSSLSMWVWWVVPLLTMVRLRVRLVCPVLTRVRKLVCLALLLAPPRELRSDVTLILSVRTWVSTVVHRVLKQVVARLIATPRLNSFLLVVCRWTVVLVWLTEPITVFTPPRLSPVLVRPVGSVLVPHRGLQVVSIAP